MNYILRFRTAFAVLLVCFVIATSSFGHDILVHKKIADTAARAASNLALFLKDNIGRNAADPTKAPKFDGKTPFEWIVEGSEREDDKPRVLNHFYNPLTNGGLADYTTIFMFIFGTLTPPVSSQPWATLQENSGPGGPNRWTWQGARAWQYNALTDTTKASRDQAFAKMFRSLGQTTHLIADLSQPGHTRNDAHGLDLLTNYIEEYGKRNVENLSYPQESLDWKAAGFTKINDFWDHSLYFGTAAPLNNNQGIQTLGLAEFTNGNFLSEDALYGDTLPTGNNRKHPFPSLASSTNFSALSINPTVGYRDVTLADGTEVTRIYVSKVADGISLDAHAAVTAIGYAAMQENGGKLPPSYGVSLMDDRVLKEYHSILIPQGVRYVAGALDYFFRGKLDLRVRWDPVHGLYKLTITNGSSQQFKGGYFKLYFDTQSGERDRLTLNLPSTWGSGSTLQPGNSLEATFEPPSGTVAGYTLLYKGTIGEDGFGNSGDQTDSGIAIAARDFKILRFNVLWNPISDIDLYLTDPDGTIIWYGNKQSELGELDIDNIGNTGPENITLKSVIDGDYQVWVNYYRDHVIEDPDADPDPPTPITVTMKTYFNGSTAIDTNTFTLNEPNYGADRPVGTTGPATQTSWHIRKLVKVLDSKLTEH